jgi:hypothetical protein
MMVLLQEAQWCSSCWCFFSQRERRPGLVVLVFLLVKGASAESAMMVLLQEAQWCSSCWCFFSRREHRLNRLGSDGCC